MLPVNTGFDNEQFDGFVTGTEKHFGLAIGPSKHLNFR
jgi:hypothetical protein